MTSYLLQKVDSQRLQIWVPQKWTHLCINFQKRYLHVQIVKLIHEITPSLNMVPKANKKHNHVPSRTGKPSILTCQTRFWRTSGSRGTCSTTPTLVGAVLASREAAPTLAANWVTSTSGAGPWLQRRWRTGHLASKTRLLLPKDLARVVLLLDLFSLSLI